MRPSSSDNVNAFFRGKWIGRELTLIGPPKNEPNWKFILRQNLDLKDRRKIGEGEASRAASKAEDRSRWIAEKQRKLGTAKNCVAVANTNARII